MSQILKVILMSIVKNYSFYQTFRPFNFDKSSISVLRWVVEVNRPAKCDVCLQTGRNCYKTLQSCMRGTSVAPNTARWRRLWSSSLLSPPSSSQGGWTWTTSRSPSMERRKEELLERAPGFSGARSTRATVSVGAQVTQKHSSPLLIYRIKFKQSYTFQMFQIFLSLL